MSGVIPPLPQYTFVVWCLVKAQGQLYLYHIPVMILFRIRVTRHDNTQDVAMKYRNEACNKIIPGTS